MLHNGKHIRALEHFHCTTSVELIEAKKDTPMRAFTKLLAAGAVKATCYHLVLSNQERLRLTLLIGGLRPWLHFHSCRSLGFATC